MGFWNEFMDTDAEFIGIEAGGPENSKFHAAPLTNGSKIGILHGAAQYVIQDKEGQIGLTRIDFCWFRLSWNFTFTLFFKRY